MKQARKWEWAGVGALALSVGTIAAAGVSYQIIDLGTLTDRTSGASSVNALGAVTGASAISGGYTIISKDPWIVVAEPWFVHAFYWNGGPMQDLGVLGPDVPPKVFPKPDSAGLSINIHSQIVGRGNQPFQGWQGILWLQEPAYGLPAGTHEVPPPPGGDNTQAWAINDAGQIVGESRQPGELGPRPFRWTINDGKWEMLDLGDLGGPYGRAKGVNQLGQIVGEANTPLTPDGSTLQAFLWLPKPAYGLPAGINSLPIPALGFSNGLDINDLGQVVGWVGLFTSYIWLPEPAYGLPQGSTILDPSLIPDAFGSHVSAINNHGVAVGTVYVDITTPSGGKGTGARAMIWQDDQMRLLEDLFQDSGGSGWMLYGASDINNNGQIVGFGLPPGETEMTHAFRIDPVVTEPADLDGDGDVDGVDLAILLGDWGFCAGCILPVEPPITCPADLNGDCQIDGFDLAILLAAWGS